MLTVRFGYVFVLTFLHYTNGNETRRIIGGADVKTQKPYMAYLLQAKSSIRNYDSWICGGAIIDRWLMLTSAACVEDVQNMYAIAGTEEYVQASEMEEVQCTLHFKRKVVYTCVPVAYELEYDTPSKWSYNDIAVVKVEKPFVLDGRFWKHCSYSPVVIPVNFDPKYEQPGTEAIALGWGHSGKWRLKNSTVDMNQKKLQYVPVSVTDNEECKKEFTSPDLGKQIDDYMICTNRDGKLDETGKPIDSRKYYADEVLRAAIAKELTSTELEENIKDYSNKSTPEEYRRIGKGFCQNDHGGPLVTWINGIEHVIGIISVFRVDPQSNCVGPFLYTSTAKNKAFIDCILKDLTRTDDIKRRRSLCENPKTGKNFAILRSYVKWTAGSTDRLASDHNVHLRPQIPMSHYGGK